MQDKQHFIALQNAQLRIRLRKTENDIGRAEEELRKFLAENQEISTKMNQIGDNLMMKIEKDAEVYMKKIQEIEQSEIFVENRELDERINDLRGYLTQSKAKNDAMFGTILAYVIAFLLGMLLLKLLKT